MRPPTRRPLHRFVPAIAWLALTLTLLPGVALGDDLAGRAVDDGGAELAAVLAELRAANGPLRGLQGMRLQHLLARHPQLAAKVARAYPTISDRLRLFQISRALLPFSGVPEVRTAMLAQLGAGASAAHRRMALHALRFSTDAEVLGQVTDVYVAEGEPDKLRQTAGFILIDTVDHLGIGQRQQVRKASLSLLATAESPELRMRALELLDETGLTPMDVRLLRARIEQERSSDVRLRALTILAGNLSVSGEVLKDLRQQELAPREAMAATERVLRASVDAKLAASGE